MRPAARNTMSNPGQRQLRVGELLRRRLAAMLQRREFDEPLLRAAPLTISEVRMSADLKIARAYVMPLGGAQSSEVARALNAHAPSLQREMVQGLRLKFTPALKFSADDRFAHAREIDSLLSSPAVRRDLDAKPRP